jgi:aminoglycoside phosphotransferase (APT) family kinase protein
MTTPSRRDGPAQSLVHGDPLWAVLIPPRLARFRELVDIGDEPLEIDLTGWNKFVLLGPASVYLFPRRADGVEWFEFELAAYRALERVGIRIVPRVEGQWLDESVYPYPFAAVSRLPGLHPLNASDLLDQLGRSIAQWHGIVPPELRGARPPGHHDRSDNRWLRRALDPTTTRDAVAEAADRLASPDRIERWIERLEAWAQLPHVLVHGDLHEDQLLVVDGQLTGILDWETARIDHPFWDFDLAEWGTGLWRRHRFEFSRLWSVAWRSYAVERGLDIDPLPLETAFRLRHALFLLDNERNPMIAGTIDEHLAAI